VRTLHAQRWTAPKISRTPPGITIVHDDIGGNQAGADPGSAWTDTSRWMEATYAGMPDFRSTRGSVRDRRPRRLSMARSALRSDLFGNRHGAADRVHGMSLWEFDSVRPAVAGSSRCGIVWHSSGWPE